MIMKTSAVTYYLKNLQEGPDLNDISEYIYLMSKSACRSANSSFSDFTLIKIPFRKGNKFLDIGFL